MSRRARFISYGSAAVLVLAGVLCAALVSGGAGPVLAMVLIGLGLVLATALVFLEVGLSEDRQLAREQRQRDRTASARPPRRPTRLKSPSLGRARDHPRRLK